MPWVQKVTNQPSLSSPWTGMSEGAGGMQTWVVAKIRQVWDSFLPGSYQESASVLFIHTPPYVPLSSAQEVSSLYTAWWDYGYKLQLGPQSPGS
jgi:hypothetical protein